jgi:hypothetical protein
MGQEDSRDVLVWNLDVASLAVDAAVDSTKSAN